MRIAMEKSHSGNAKITRCAHAVYIAFNAVRGVRENRVKYHLALPGGWPNGRRMRVLPPVAQQVSSCWSRAFRLHRITLMFGHAAPHLHKARIGKTGLRGAKPRA